MPLATTIQKKNQPSAPSWCSGFARGPKASSSACSTRSKTWRPLRRMPFERGIPTGSGGGGAKGMAGGSCVAGRPGMGTAASGPRRRRAALAQGTDDESGDAAERDEAGPGRDENRPVEAVAVARRIVHRAEKADAVQPATEDAGLRTDPEHELLQRLDQRRRLERLSVHLCVHEAVAIHDRGLREMLEAARGGSEDEAQLAGEGFDRGRIGAHEMPVGTIDAALAREARHACRRVVGR